MKVRLSARVCALACLAAAMGVIPALAQDGKLPTIAKKSRAEIAADLVRYQSLKKLRYDDVAAAGHGALFLADGRTIEPDAATIERLVDTFLADLSTADEQLPADAFSPNDSGAGKAQEAFKENARRAGENKSMIAEALKAGKFENADQRIMAKIVLLQAAVRRDDPESLNRKIAAPAAPFDADKMRLKPYLHEQADMLTYAALRINRYGLIRFRDWSELYWRADLLREILRRLILRYGPDNGYVQRCAAEGVPTPPDWPNSFHWSALQPLDWSKNLLQLGMNTKVSTYSVTSGPQEGLCIALPRTSGTFTSTFGIICQSKQTGKACFFDNIDVNGTIAAEESAITLRINELFNGDNLANCTSCHRGGNVFLVTPGTPLQHPLGTPLVRYAPVSSQGWTNPSFHPQGSSDASGNFRACASCHEIPSVTGGNYCGSVLKQAATRTMPSSASPAGWPPLGASAYGAHIAEMRAAGCL